MRKIPVLAAAVLVSGVATAMAVHAQSTQGAKAIVDDSGFQTSSRTLKVEGLPLRGKHY